MVQGVSSAAAAPAAARRAAPGPADPPASAPAVSSFGELYRSLWQYGRAARGRMLLACSMLTASQLIKLAIPFCAAQAINAIQLGGTQRLGDAALWIGLIVLAAVTSWALHGPGRIIERGFGVEVRTRLADALVERVLHLPLAWHQRHHSGEVQHRVGQATRALYDFAQSQFIYLQNAVNVLGPVIALGLIALPLGIGALFGLLATGVVIARFDTALMRLALRENAAERSYAASVIDLVANVATLMSLRLQSAARVLARGRLAEVFKPLRRSIVLNEAKWCAVDLLSVVLTWSLVVGYALTAHGAGGTLMIGTLFMIYQYAQQAGSVVGALAVHYQAIARTRTDFASAQLLWQSEVQAAVPAVQRSWRNLSCIRLAHPHRTANGRSAGIHDISLTIRRGERVALFGPSGCGKSTLLRVLAGLYEAKGGRIEIDGVVQLGRADLAGFATLIPQEADVFEMSVRENITFGAAVAEAALDDALHVSGFDEVLATLPAGLETPIAERGYNLSGGQRQRLALARGVLAARDSSVLLLDEPTSALDPETEIRVHRRIDTAFRNVTIAAAVHRVNLLSHYDTVVLMADGRIVDAGPLADLIDRQPEFARWVNDARDARNAHERHDQTAARGALCTRI